MELGVSTPFTPVASSIGGILIGLSAVMVMGLFGRIAGIVGITGGAMGRASDRDWRWAFLAVLVAAPLPYALVAGWPPQTVPGSPIGMAVAGLLVGVGTALGSGCTSGHGVCGLARLSGRSLVAVLTFMGSAVLTVFALRHLV